MRALRIPLVLVVLSSSPAAAEDAPPSKRFLTFEDDWPSFRGGPDLLGYREGAISDSPRLLWTFDAKTEIESTAAIAAGKAIIGTETGLLALDIAAKEKEGKELWRAKAEGKVAASPAVRDGKAYFGDESGVFHAVDLKTGAEAWSFKPEGASEIASSANFAGDAVLFGSYDTRLYALSAADGKLRWQFETQGPVHATPAVIEGRTFVAGCDEELRSIDLTAGKEVSSLAMGAYSAASPLVWGDRLVVGTFGMQVLCIGWRDMKLLWTYQNPERQFPYYSSPALYPAGAGGKGTVVVGGRDKLIHAIALESGKLLWSFPTKARIDASPVIVGKRVLAAGLDGNLYMLDVEDGKEVWTFQGGAGFAASPAVGAGRLVISNQDGLVHCFDLRRG
jgi:eukaryotic-like serine/threonine-protein kinase